MENKLFQEETAMRFRFNFHQWHPNSDIHSHDDAPAVEDKKGKDLDMLLQLWKRWLREFPNAFKMVTLAYDSQPSMNYVQLRFWFGEPRSIRHGYVDSCGHNLIVHIGGEFEDRAWLSFLRAYMVGDLRFSKEVVDGVEVWRRT